MSLIEDYKLGILIVIWTIIYTLLQGQTFIEILITLAMIAAGYVAGLVDGRRQLIERK
jgi:hypothetical protein